MKLFMRLVKSWSRSVKKYTLVFKTFNLEFANPKKNIVEKKL